MALRATVDRNRRELRDLQAELVRTLAASYADAIRQIEADIADLHRAIAAREAAGRPVSRAWLLRQEAMERAVETIRRELARIHGAAAQTVEGQQARAVTLGEQHALALIDEALGPRPVGVNVSLTGVPFEAVAELLAQSGPGTPLAALFDRLAPLGAERAREALLYGLLRGHNANVIGKALSKALGLPLARSITIARTEVLRAYREASRQTYLANPRVVKAWQWVAALDGRTCMACVMMHGTMHPLSEPFGSHPRCRCVARPVTATWEELGFEGIPDRRPEIESGRDWFLRQPPARQREMLGPSRYEAWADGAIDLDDIVAYRDHPEWGPTRSTASLKQMLGARRAREYYPQAAD